jgi:hypothetical protein
MDVDASVNLSSTMTAQCSPIVGGEMEGGLRSVVGISETALGELADPKPIGSIVSRLDQIIHKVTAAFGSFVAALREVLDDRFWE